MLKIQLKWSREDDGLRPSCEHWRVGRRGGAAVLVRADGWRCTELGQKRLPPRIVPHNNTTNVKLYHLTICSTWAGFKNLSPCTWRRHRRRPSCHLSRPRGTLWRREEVLTCCYCKGSMVRAISSRKLWAWVRSLAGIPVQVGVPVQHCMASLLSATLHSAPLYNSSGVKSVSILFALLLLYSPYYFLLSSIFCFCMRSLYSKLHSACSVVTCFTYLLPLVYTVFSVLYVVLYSIWL